MYGIDDVKTWFEPTAQIWGRHGKHAGKGRQIRG